MSVPPSPGRFSSVLQPICPLRRGGCPARGFSPLAQSAASSIPTRKSSVFSKLTLFSRSGGPRHADTFLACTLVLKKWKAPRKLQRSLGFWQRLDQETNRTRQILQNHQSTKTLLMFSMFSPAFAQSLQLPDAFRLAFSKIHNILYESKPAVCSGILASEQNILMNYFPFQRKNASKLIKEMFGLYLIFMESCASPCHMFFIFCLSFYQVTHAHFQPPGRIETFRL